MFTILVRNDSGSWSDNIGQASSEDNAWPTEAAAQAAIAELQHPSVGFSTNPEDWKIVETESLASREVAW